VIQVRDTPACGEDHSVDSLHLLKVDLLDHIARPVIVPVHSGEIKDNRNPVLRVIVVVRSIVEALRMPLVIVGVVELQSRGVQIGFFVELVQLG